MIHYGRQTIDSSDEKAVLRTLRSDYLTTGPMTKKFEKELALKLGFKHVVVLSNGTAALHLSSLVILDKGDRVLTTPNSFLATSNSILYVGAEPIFIDICDNGLLDLDLVEERLKKGDIDALYLVSFSGLPFNDERLKYLKNRYNIKILLDNAHYFYKDSGICDLATYSFHPVKHITTFEGGAIGTNDEDIHKKLLRLHNHGIYKDENMYPWEYKMRDLGYNYRLSDVASSLGLSQLKRVDGFLNKRKEIAKLYHQKLKKATPLYSFSKQSSYHLFAVRYPFKDLDEKAKFFIEMKKRGIGLQYHYIPINSQPFYKNLGFSYTKKEFPVMDRYYKETFSIPIYPSLKESEQTYVIEQMEKIL